jgi:deoxyadenosine/deoxycytidine kinase
MTCSKCANSFHVAIEGTIGAGKSTFLDILKNYLREVFNEEFLVLPEPIDLWTNCEGENLLEKQYQDPKNYAFQFQVWAASTKLGQLVKSVEKFLLVERTLAAQLMVFLPSLHQSLKATETTILESLLSSSLKHPRVIPNVIIYLRLSYVMAKARVWGRKRPEEGGLRTDTMIVLDALYDKWLLNEGVIPVIIIEYTHFLTESQLSELAKLLHEISLGKKIASPYYL